MGDPLLPSLRIGPLLWTATGRVSYCATVHREDSKVKGSGGGSTEGGRMRGSVVGGIIHYKII